MFQHINNWNMLENYVYNCCPTSEDDELKPFLCGLGNISGHINWHRWVGPYVGDHLIRPTKNTWLNITGYNRVVYHPQLCVPWFWSCQPLHHACGPRERPPSLHGHGFRVGISRRHRISPADATQQPAEDLHGKLPSTLGSCHKVDMLGPTVKPLI